MRILMIGAGAVGQVYGHHLARGGAEVAFFVKPKYADALRKGMTLYRLQIGRKPERERLEGCRILTSLDEVQAETWDQVWLCISTPALQGEWLEDLLAAIGGATLVVLQPGLGVRDRVLGAWQRALGEGADPATLRSRVVTGLITAVAYQAPLPGDGLTEPGIAFWLPPLSPLPLGGDLARIGPVVQAFITGGCPARFAANVGQQGAIGMSLLQPLIAALEASGWSMSGLRRSPLLGLACRASQQMLTVAAAHEGVRPPLARMLAQPWIMGIVLGLAPALVPMPFETYLKYHFTKVGEQTRELLAHNIELGERHGLDVSAMRELAATLTA